MDVFYFLFVVLAFLAVVGIIEGVFLIWNTYSGPEARLIERRLQAMSAGVASIESPLLKKRLLSEAPAMERLLLSLPRIHVLDRLLIQSGSTMNVADFLGISAACALLAGIITSMLAAPTWLSVTATIVSALMPLGYVRRLASRRLSKIEQQLPDALDLMARAMQAGHAFSSALRMVAMEGPEPIAREFRTTFDEINFGVSMQNALVNLAARVESADLRYFVIAVLIQRETGGNLAELLSSIAGLIRDRFKLIGTVRVLSAEGRLSAWVLGLLPFALAGVIHLVNPQFMSLLWTDPEGIKMIGGALFLMAIGVIWMWRMIDIRI
jgi:tight adherence protein B